MRCCGSCACSACCRTESAREHTQAELTTVIIEAEEGGCCAGGDTARTVVTTEQLAGTVTRNQRQVTLSVAMPPWGHHYCQLATGRARL